MKKSNLPLNRMPYFGSSSSPSWSFAVGNVHRWEILSLKQNAFGCFGFWNKVGLFQGQKKVRDLQEWSSISRWFVSFKQCFTQTPLTIAKVTDVSHTDFELLWGEWTCKSLFLTKSFVFAAFLWLLSPLLSVSLCFNFNKITKLNAIHRADLLSYVSGKQDMQRVSEFLRPLVLQRLEKLPKWVTFPNFSWKCDEIYKNYQQKVGHCSLRSMTCLWMDERDIYQS